MNIYRSFSSLETKHLGASLAKQIIKKPLRSFRGALVLALFGGLGSGKTTFSQGFLRGLGVREAIKSPTFIIVKHYAFRSSWYRDAYHIDCYRIKNARDIFVLGFKDILRDPRAIIVVEWASKIVRALPKQRINVRFRHGKKEHERIIAVKQ